MQTTIFDIETNGIKNFIHLDGLEKIHCIALMDIGDDKPRLLPVDAALEHLRKADIIVGHNCQAFDIRAIQKLYPNWNYTGCVRDTLLLSRLAYPDVRTNDFKRVNFPSNLAGSHSLKSWGIRLGILKGDFGETSDWSEYSEEMGEYCKQDVLVTKALWDKLESLDLSADAVIREHEFARIIRQQERNGIGFNVKKAQHLYSELVGKRLDIETKMRKEFPPTIQTMKTPQYYLDESTGEQYLKKKDAPSKLQKELVAGPMKIKKTPFNPGSRLEIARVLKDKYGWKPTVFTGEGRPKVDESVLSSLEYPEAKEFALYLLITKRLGMLGDGNEAWLKLERNGKIHGEVNTNGAVSTRCTHRRCNMAQVPSVGSPWGTECRSLFRPTSPDNIMVGVDASSLELRTLSHYLHPYDDGEYVAHILDGDIHTVNQNAAGLSSRNEAKVMIYSMIYGAGDDRLGKIVGGGRREGRHLRERFLSRMPAIEILQNRAKSKDILRALDGRKLPVRSKHSALNLLLQSAGAIIMKEATILMHRIFAENKIKGVRQLAHVHDEVQFECPRELGDRVGELAVRAIRETTEVFGFRCPLDGEFRIGNNWAETH